MKRFKYSKLLSEKKKQHKRLDKVYKSELF